MVEYRFYCLDEDGHIGTGDWIEAEDDEDAIAKVRKARPDARKCEIWRNNNLIARLNDAGNIERQDHA